MTLCFHNQYEKQLNRFAKYRFFDVPSEYVFSISTAQGNQKTRTLAEKHI